MSEQSNLAIVQACYEAFGRGDIQALLSHCTPDIEWHYPGPNTIPFAGSRRGHRGATEFFATLAEFVEIEAFEPQRFFASGDQVVVVGHEHGRMKRNGAPWAQHWAHLFTFSNGKVSAWREYGDNSAIAAALTA